MPRITNKTAKTIGFDLDDTIVNHGPNRQKLIKKMGLPSHDPILKKALYTEMPIASRPPHPNSIETIKRIIQAGHRVIIVSRQKEDGRQLSRQWLAKHLPELDAKNIFFVDSDEAKGVVCKKNKVDIFIDDLVKPLSSIDCQKTICILFNSRAEILDKKILALADWQELEKFFEKQGLI